MLEGKLVNLRPIEKKDLEEMMKWINDQEVTHYLSNFLYPISQADEEEFLERMMRHKDTEKDLVIETKAGSYLGQISLRKIDRKNKDAELGIVIGHKDYWDKGYGTDAIKTLLRYAFGQLNLSKVYLQVFEYNQRGIHCYKKCGFKEEDRLKKEQFYDGKYYDVILMEVRKEEFEKMDK